MKSALVIFLALAASGVHADPRDEVQRAFEQVLVAGGFRGYAQGQVFGAGLPAVSGDVDVLLPDRIHASTDNLEFIVIGERAWISTLGVWAAVDRSMVPVTAFDVAAMRKAIASIRDVALDGTAKTQQCPARVYRFHASGNLPGAPANGELKIWICDIGGKPARLEASNARTREHVVFDFDWSRRPAVRPPN
ncbi:MAG: hypothetical protein ABI846_12315 [Rudaea sp.]